MSNSEFPNLTTKVKNCDSEIKDYIVALKQENLKLQKQILKFQVEKVTLNNRIKTLEKEAIKPKFNLTLVEKYNNQNNPQK